jgi:opacity protein-like surface antigen
MIQVGSLMAVLLAAVPAQAQTPAPAKIDAPRATADAGRWRGGLRLGAGRGGFDLVDENCAELALDLVQRCDGDDSGFAWMAAADLRWLATDRFDLTIRGGMIRPSKITIEGTTAFEGLDLSAGITAKGTIWTVGAEAGVRPTPRFRLYGGGGVSPFTFDTRITFRFLGETTSEEESHSAVGRSAWGGAEWQMNDRVSLFGEAGRTWLKDDDVNGESFDEAFTTLIVGIRLGFGF